MGLGVCDEWRLTPDPKTRPVLKSTLHFSVNPASRRCRTHMANILQKLLTLGEGKQLRAYE